MLQRTQCRRRIVLTVAFEEDCPFCQIAAGHTDAVLVAQNARWLAFFPEDPATTGHTLIVPRAHVTDFWAMPAGTGTYLNQAAVQVGNAIKAALQPDGLNLITSSGAAAEQSVFHLHLHLVPRWSGDRFGPIWPAQGEGSADRALAESIGRIYGSAAQ